MMDRPCDQSQVCGDHADSTQRRHQVAPGRSHCRQRTPTSTSTKPAVASRHRDQGRRALVDTRTTLVKRAGRVHPWPADVWMRTRLAQPG